MRSGPGNASPSEPVRLQSYTHSPYTRFEISDEASPARSIDISKANGTGLSFSQPNSPHASVHATTSARLFSNIHVSSSVLGDFDATTSPMSTGASVPIRVIGSSRRAHRLRTSAPNRSFVGSNCSENDNMGLVSGFRTPWVSGSALGLNSSQVQEDGMSFVGSPSNGDRARSLSHSWHPPRSGARLQASDSVCDHDELNRIGEAPVVPTPPYCLPLPQPGVYGYPTHAQATQSNSYAPAGFSPNPISHPLHGTRSPMLSSPNRWWANNSIHSDSEFAVAPKSASFSFTQVGPMQHQSSYPNRGFNMHGTTPKQASPYDGILAGGCSAERHVVITSADNTASLCGAPKSKAYDETDASSSRSGSTNGSLREHLPLCPEDELCSRINNRNHQTKFAHTCRLFPCYHGHVRRHAKLFRHIDGQIAQPMGFDATRMSTNSLASVNFNQISLEAPNAYRIYVSHGDKSHEIFGDWANVKVHTFKRYLHQVYHIPPSSQKLVLLKTGRVLDDEIATVKSYEVEQDTVLLLEDSYKDLDHQSGRIPFDEL